MQVTVRTKQWCLVSLRVIEQVDVMVTIESGRYLV